jgi:hypothetical protein
MAVNNYARSGQLVGRILMVVGQVHTTLLYNLWMSSYDFLPTDYTLVDSEYLLPIPEDVIPSEAAPILCAGVHIPRYIEVSMLKLRTRNNRLSWSENRQPVCRTMGCNRWCWRRPWSFVRLETVAITAILIIC